MANMSEIISKCSQAKTGTWGLMHQVLDREVEGSNLAVNLSAIEKRKGKEANEKRSMQTEDGTIRDVKKPGLENRRSYYIFISA